MSNSIPLVDVKAQYEHLIPQIQERIGEVLDSGVFILGPHVRAFEEEAAAYLGVPRTIGVANGTDALVLALDAMGIGPGDEVICPTFTFYATAESIARRGATPVFAEIDPVTLNLDPEDVGAKVTERTRALMPVHLFGRLMPLDGLAGLDVPIVEDAAQAFGAPGVARVGVLSTFSFFPTKNLFGLGDGGLIAANDDALADTIALLRFHGSKAKKEFELIGYNSRLDELQAAVLRLFLEQIEGWTQARRDAAARYEELGLGELCELPLRRAEPRLPHVRRPLARAGPPRRGARCGRDRPRVVLRDAPAPPARAALPRVPGRRVPGDRAGFAREPRAADVGGDSCGDAGAGGGRDPRGSGGARVIPINRHRIWQLVADGLLVALAWWLAFELRFDNGIPVFYETLFRRSILIVVAIKLVVFVFCGFYNRWWRYVSTRDMWRIAYGVALASVLADVAVYLVSPVHGVKLPRGIAALDLLLCLALIAGSRLLARTLMERPSGGGLVARGKEVLVVGAGDAGQLVIRELQRNRQLGYTPIGLVDDDRRKKNLRIHGVRVLGTTDELPHILRDNRPDEVLIAIPSASGEARRRIVTITRENNVPVKTLPGLYDLISGESELAAQIRPRAGRGRARARAGRGRPRGERRVPARSDRAHNRRGRIDRLGALPPDRTARPAAARARGPGRDGAVRDRARARRRARLRRRRSPSSATARARPRCARSWSGTSRRSSSTRPRTSTCR